jgi:hypothetical protein
MKRVANPQADTSQQRVLWYWQVLFIDSEQDTRNPDVQSPKSGGNFSDMRVVQNVYTAMRRG